MPTSLELAIVALLIIVNGFLALSELAVVSSRKALLKSRAEDGSRRARAALKLAQEPGRFLSTVQIGITLIGIVAGAFSGATLGGKLAAELGDVPLLAPYAGAIGIGAVVAVITYASVIMGELAPKQIALSNPEGVACFVAIPMTFLDRLAAPLVWLLDRSSDVVLRLFGIRARSPAMTEEEIKAVIAESTTAGVLAPEEQEMMRAVMRFADRRLRTLMTPRLEVVWLDLDDPPEKLVATIRETRHARYPVCTGDLDGLLGVVVARDLLDAFLEGKELDIRAHIQPVEALPDSAGALTVLEHLKRSPMHFTVVVDEYGIIEGIVTATDVLSALIGGVAQHGEPVAPQAIQRKDGSWLLDGDMDAGAAAETLNLRELGEDDAYATLAGFMLSHFRTLPRPGQSFGWKGWRFEVMDMDGRRIDKVLAVPPEPEEGEET